MTLAGLKLRQDPGVVDQVRAGSSFCTSRVHWRSQDGSSGNSSCHWVESFIGASGSQWGRGLSMVGGLTMLVSVYFVLLSTGTDGVPLDLEICSKMLT